MSIYHTVKQGHYNTITKVGSTLLVSQHLPHWLMGQNLSCMNESKLRFNHTREINSHENNHASAIKFKNIITCHGGRLRSKHLL